MVGTSNKSDPENPIDRRQCQVPKLKGIWFLPTWLDRIGTWPACGAPVFSWSGIVFWQTPPFVVKKTVLQSPLFGNIYIYNIYMLYIYILHTYTIFSGKKTHVFLGTFSSLFFTWTSQCFLVSSPNLRETVHVVSNESLEIPMVSSD